MTVGAHSALVNIVINIRSNFLATGGQQKHGATTHTLTPYQYLWKIWAYFHIQQININLQQSCFKANILLQAIRSGPTTGNILVSGC